MVEWKKTSTAIYSTSTALFAFKIPIFLVGTGVENCVNSGEGLQ